MISGLKKLVPEPIKNYYHFLVAFFGAITFGFPSRKLKVIGVTGTDGKTTTCHLIHHILNKTGQPTGLLSTVEARIGDQSFETGLHVTTPAPFAVQSILKKMVNAGTKYAVLETTSHALAQERVAFVNFQVGVVTNITIEHLDYHGSFENYLSTKAKILKKVKLRILNADDRSFSRLKDMGSGQLISFAIEEPADVTAKNVKHGSNSTEFSIHFLEKQKTEKIVEIKSRLIGDYNTYNMLAAFAATTSLGVEAQAAAAAISSFPGVPGRMQYIDEGQKFDCIVDFAHTPAALEVVLRTLNRFKKGKIIVVFGCAGERDLGKRAVMGKIATQLADYSIFTAEDPRKENVNQIIEQMAQGALAEGGIPNRTFWKIPDRGEAINTAIGTLAAEGDIVAILGKGHEKSMSISGKEYPWSDEQIARSSLKTRGNK